MSSGCGPPPSASAMARPRSPVGDPAIEHGFRSGLEGANSAFLKALGHPVLYEILRIPYVKPSSLHVYTPDFELMNGIVVETKGKFELSDRKKHLLVKAQHPHLDIRFVFTNPNARIYKGSPTTYGDWCARHGFIFAKKLIPADWLTEPGPGKVKLTPRNKLPFQDAPQAATEKASRKKD